MSRGVSGSSEAKGATPEEAEEERGVIFPLLVILLAIAVPVALAVLAMNGGGMVAVGLGVVAILAGLAVVLVGMNNIMDDPKT